MAVTKEQWEKESNWEANWHIANNNCANSYAEETKQFDYAHRMGLDKFKYNRYDLVGWDFGDNTVLDVGAGPYSILLKSKAKRMVALDPCDYPNWTYVRYKECGIEFIKQKAEEMEFDKPFDIILCYNVLQHVENPEEICRRMRKYSKLIYFFDWCEIGVCPGHPWNLHPQELNKWLGGEGKVEPTAPPKRGVCYSGIFLGDHYER